MKPIPHRFPKTVTRLGLAIPACAMLLTGCYVTSVYPWYTAKDIIFKPALIGTWVEAEATNAPNESVRFERGEGEAYVMTFVEPDKSVTHDAVLFKLRNQLFLDYIAGDAREDAIPPHQLLKVDRLSPTLQLRGLNYKWLEELLKQNPKAIRHHVVKSGTGDNKSERVVLTADTAELRKFLLRHLEDPDAFDAPGVLKRQ